MDHAAADKAQRDEAFRTVMEVLMTVAEIAFGAGVPQEHIIEMVALSKVAADIVYPTPEDRLIARRQLDTLAERAFHEDFVRDVRRMRLARRTNGDLFRQLDIPE